MDSELLFRGLLLVVGLAVPVVALGLLWNRRHKRAAGAHGHRRVTLRDKRSHHDR